jgi:signal transduction histidine kinase
MLLRQMRGGSRLDEQIVQRALQAIEQQTERLTRLVTRLLDIARIEGGRLGIVPVTTDLVPLVRALVESIQVRAPGHRIQVSTPASLVGQVDPLPLEQVLSNLLDNAVKFSPEGAQIAVELAETSVGMARLTVTDQGPGIKAEDRDRIFERFYQAHGGQYAAGLGLGLYISRQIVEQHGGSIRVEESATGGARFVVVLPLQADARHESHPDPTQQAAT